MPLTVTVVWTGYAEIMVKLWNNDTDSFELLVDDVSLVDASNQQVLAKLYTFEDDTVGAAPSGVAAFNGTFDSMTVVNVPQADYTSTWAGNTWGGAGSYFTPRVNHVQMQIDSMAVASDGTVYTNSAWDESHKLLGIYRDGLDHGQLLQATNQYSWVHPDGGAIAVNSTHVFVSVRHGSFRRYLRSNRTPAGADVTVCTQKLTGLAASATEVFVSDPQNQKIKVYDAATLAYLREFAVSTPANLALDAAGGLWVLQRGAVTNEVRCYNATTGTATGQVITFPATVYPTALAYNPTANRVMVADGGIDSRIRYYNPTWLSGTPTSMTATFGAANGIYGGTRGAYAPLKFVNLTGVGVDSSGHVYVASSSLNESGVSIESYTSSGTRRWDLQNHCFVATADLDPGSENDLYTSMHRMRLDYTKGYDAFWKPGAYTFDPIRFPHDARAHLDHNFIGVIAVRRIQGKKFVYLTNMYADWLAVYRFDSTAHGEIAVPCGLWANKNLGAWPSTQPASGEWIWSDLDGDAVPEAGEYSTPGTGANAPHDTWGWMVDANGDVWQCSETAGIRRFAMTGLVNNTPHYSHTSRTTYAMPAPFTQLRRVEYDAANDALYLCGYTADYTFDKDPNTAGVQEEWGKTAGRVLARYSNWLAGNRTAAWTVENLVFKINNAEQHKNVVIAAIAIAGDYVFTQWGRFDAEVNDQRTDVYRASDGAFVKTFTPGPTASLDQAQIDMPYGMRAARRANGEYVVMVEDDWFGKILIYRWTPEVTVDNASSTEVTLTGDWTASTHSPGFHGANYLHDGNTNKGAKSVRFTPYLNPGTYTVQLRWAADPNRSSNVPVTIIHASGTAHTSVDQRTHGGAWNSVGGFRFDVGTGGHVTISTGGTTGHVIADAVRFVRIGD